MIETKTLLIVGAGASVPYGYPTGYTLREALCDPRKLDNLQNKINALELKVFCQHFEESQLNSIDAFLAKRGENQIGNSNGPIHSTYMDFGTYENCGKLAIAQQLVECENIEDLIRPKEDHWLQYLWNLMSDVPKAEFNNNLLKIISFNYDRVIEQYFQTVLENSFGTDYKEASELRKSIEIIHVYGNLQDLDKRAYGGKPDDIAMVAKCIRVIPEARDADDVQFEKAKKLIGWADKICFIGFSFDPTNVHRLGFPHHKLFGKTIYFTQFGLTVNESKAAQRLLGEGFNSFIDSNAKFTKLKTLAYMRHEGVFLSL